MNKEVNITTSNEQASEPYRLWIDDEWYIRVDEEGRCVGKCGEGALGFIVQLSSKRDEKAVRALKIPRLVAETERENAYIGELLAQELAAVRNIFDQPGDKTGLVGARDISSPFQGSIRIERIEEALEWNGSLLFVRFEKGENPYFCLVRQDSDKPYPPKASFPKLTKAIYEQIRRLSRDSTSESGKQAEPWSQMVFLSQRQEGIQEEAAENIVASQLGPVFIFNSNTALNPEQTSAAKTWYTSIPSVTYDWAPNTLQEAIGRSDRGGQWSIDDHLELIEQVCKGIKVLHNKGMLHADIRPANIVYLGDPRNPSNYVLSDYGSFAYSNAQPLQADNNIPQGGTLTGPVIEGERVSPFYAPERGSGRERETADTAIIVLPGHGPYCYAIVGWKAEFSELGLLDEVAKPTMDADGYTNFINQRQQQYAGESAGGYSLNIGDRVQLRDYVFELIAPEEILGNIMIFHCDPKFWTIYHGRIAINENRQRQSCFSFPIPRIVELPQWSAATDIYSLGVLCLYSVYSELLTHRKVIPPVKTNVPLTNKTEEEKELNADEKTQPTIAVQPMPFGNKKQEDTPITKTQSKASTVKLDEEFEVMLKYMADKSLFKAVWPQLEWLRKQVEDKLDEQERQHWTAERLATYPFEPKAELESIDATEQKAITSGTKPNDRNIQSETVKVISQITSTVPGIEHLLRPLSEANAGNSEIMYQLGPFIFFLHFVLCCLHRQDSLDDEKLAWVKDGWMSAPFCHNRHDQPRPGGAADIALARLVKIRSIIKAGALKGLTTEKNKIAQFDLRPESQIRRELVELKSKAREWRDVQSQLTQKENELMDVKEASSAISNKLNIMREERQKESAAQEVYKNTIEQSKQTIDALVTSFNDAINLIKEVNSFKFASNRQAIIDNMTRRFTDAIKLKPTDTEPL